MLFELSEINGSDEKAAALLRKYGPITMDVGHNDPIDITNFGDRWRTFNFGEKYWRINDVEVTETE